MRKILAIILVLVMAMGLAAAIAEGHTDVTNITVTKKYKAENDGVSPAETFTFSSFETVGSVGENPAATYPTGMPTITEITYAKGEATADGSGTGAKTAIITLPSYEAVGVYTYKFSEVTPDKPSAGVTYNNTDLYLVVTVEQGTDGKIRVAAVHCEGGHEKDEDGYGGGGNKTDVFENTYKSGTMTVTKTVTGNLGNRSKYFDVTVTFAPPAGKTINSTITYSGGQYTQAVNVVNNTATIQVKHDDTVTFSNIPEGVTYTVKEANYTTEEAGKYEAPSYTGETVAGEGISAEVHGSIAAGDTDAIGITNNKSRGIGTGIALDTLPYALLMGLVALGAALLIMGRRRRED